MIPFTFFHLRIILYGSIIQQIQSLLGRKRIKVSDVTNFYQQAERPALMISNEMEIHLITMYDKSID